MSPNFGHTLHNTNIMQNTLDQFHKSQKFVKNNNVPGVQYELRFILSTEKAIIEQVI